MSHGPDTSRHRKFLDPDGQPRVLKRRPCLCCQREFESEGPGNRLCAICRARASDVSPYEP